MRSVFCRIAETLVNIHFGGAVSGIAAIAFPKSMSPNTARSFEPRG